MTIKTKDRPFRPDWASPPGNTIRDILRERKITINKFAKMVELKPREAVRLICGDIKITKEIAELLAYGLGASTLFWVRRESQYRKQLLYLKKKKS